MTDAQRTSLYFPAWRRAWRANWIVDRGTVKPRPGRETHEMLKRVEQAACVSAMTFHRAPNEQDYRYGCHLVAIGKILSCQDLDNAQINSVVRLFNLLEKLDDLARSMRQAEPPKIDRKKVIWSIANSGFENGYICSIYLDRAGTRDWRSAPDEELHKLLITIKQRARARDKRKAQEAKPAEPGVIHFPVENPF